MSQTTVAARPSRAAKVAAVSAANPPPTIRTSGSPGTDRRQLLGAGRGPVDTEDREDLRQCFSCPGADSVRVQAAQGVRYLDELEAGIALTGGHRLNRLLERDRADDHRGHAAALERDAVAGAHRAARAAVPQPVQGDVALGPHVVELFLRRQQGALRLDRSDHLADRIALAE